MKKKVLYITEKLFHYRVPLFNMLANDYDLTIAHGGEQIKNANYNQIKIIFENKGPFVKVKNMPDLEIYDTVIISFNLRIISFYKLIFMKRSYKLLLYGIGVSASYKNRYDENKKLDWMRKIWIKRADGALFYEFYPVVKYATMGISHSKLHVAYNTVHYSKTFNINSKKFISYIFIGSLYKEKKIYELLEAYKQAFIEQNSNFPKLELIGNGTEYQNIQKWIINNQLTENIILHGSITENSKLDIIMNRAIACISPGQAGLSVQKCFSYGVPFITTKNAITGGELFSIINNVNGFFYNGTVDDLTKIMIRIVKNEELLQNVSSNAYEFYFRFRNPQIWVDSFKKAIE